MIALISLTTLNISYNELSTFPSCLCDLMNLDLLDLSHNKINAWCDDRQLAKLKAAEVNLNANTLTTLAEGLVKCERLKILRVQVRTGVLWNWRCLRVFVRTMTVGVIS